jgi:uncharacterized membrane protein YhaH (DUF805 family)
MRSYLDALLRYFEFSGRTGRAQYWIYQVVVLLLMVGLVAYQFRNGIERPPDANLGAFMVFLGLFHTIPGITITVRRLHDIGKSGWWYLLSFVPLGGLWVLFWTCCASEPGSNEYGDRDGGEPSRRPNSRRAAPEPYYARALRPSAASNPAASNTRSGGSTERFI